MSFWSIAYQFGWATKAQLGQAVGYGLISPTEYKQICGADYTAPARGGTT